MILRVLRDPKKNADAVCSTSVGGVRLAIRLPDKSLKTFIGFRAQLPRRGLPAFAGCA
jgi:hypothetical protein